VHESFSNPMKSTIRYARARGQAVNIFEIIFEAVLYSKSFLLKSIWFRKKVFFPDGVPAFFLV